MIRSKRVRFKVTTCLYLSPKIRARSLSTLTAVIVKRETDASIKPATKCALCIKRQKFQYSLTKDSQYITAEGSEIRPTQRSVVARQRYRNLDGEWRDDSLWSATKIRKFPRNAVMDRKMLMIERVIIGLCIPSAHPATHRSCASVSLCFAVSEDKFTCAIISSATFLMLFNL